MSDSVTCRPWVIVASRFHGTVVERLTEGAVECLRSKGLGDGEVELVRVSGAFEVPQAVSAVLQARRAPNAPRGVLALACVVRGETPHFEYVCSEVSRALMDVAVRHGVALGFGVLTCDTMEQALSRAGGAAGDKGWEAAEAAWDLAAVMDSIRRRGMPREP